MDLSRAIVETREGGIRLRPEQAADEPFLFRVYAGTRAEELEQGDWDEARRHGFLQMQFQAQRRCYLADYPGATLDVIELGDEPVGRLYVHRRENEIRIMDIALLPEFRRRGFGTRLLQGIQQEGGAQQKPVTIHVEVFNPARRLYQRLGVREAGTNGVYLLMRWLPNSMPALVEPECVERMARQ
jgi:ribosomal protein S18 acetylase RimI-like enzyme